MRTLDEGWTSIVALRQKGSSKKYSCPVFRELLSALFQIVRGNALVFASGAKSLQPQNAEFDALVKTFPDDLIKKPLSKCTATQLGHYLAYLILCSGTN